MAARRDGANKATPRHFYSSFRSPRSHAPRSTFSQVSALLAAFAIVGPSLSAAPALAQTWIGTTGAWSDPTKWLNGTVPTSPASLLTFTKTTETGYEAFNDLATPLRFNALNFAGTGFFAITLTGNSLSTTGANPTISQNGSSPAVISTPLVLAPSSGTTTIGGSGVGGLTLSGIVSGSGGLAINQTGTFANANGYPIGGSYVALSGANTFTGGVTLTRGALFLDNSLALGDASNTLTIVDGANSTLFTVARTVANNINVMSGPLNLASGGAGELTGTITGASGINSYGTVNVRLSGASTFTGPILLTGGAVGINGSEGGGISLGGQSVISTGSTISIEKNATLVLENASVYNPNCVADSVPINLNNGRIQYNSSGDGATVSTETLGALNITGSNAITIVGLSSENATVNFGTLTRNDNAQILFRGALNGVTSRTSNQAFFSGGLPIIATPGSTGTGVYTGVVPFASSTTFSNSAKPNGLVTYDAATGVRSLAYDNTAFLNQVASGGSLLADANNTLNGDITLSGNTRINALVVNSMSVINGTGALQVYSGAIAVNLNATLNGPTLDFGANTGYFQLGAPVVVSGASQITGSNGLVVGALPTIASTTLSLNNGVANPFIGGLFINNNAAVQFNTGDSQLGAPGGAIRLNGGTLAYTGFAATSLSAARPINIGVGGGGISSTATGAGVVLTVPNNLTGTGDLAKLRSGTVALTGNNAALTGNIIVNEGTLRYGATGLSSGGLILNAGTIVPLATNTFAGPVTVTAATTITPGAGVSQTLSGNVSGAGALNKSGAGTVVLAGASNAYAGTVTAGAGTVAVNGVFGNPFVASGGTIGGTGTTGALTVSANGMIAPGNSIGTLNATSLLFNNGGALSIELGANGVSDVLNLSGALTQGTAGTYALNFLDAGGLANGNTYNFLNFASTTFSVCSGSSPFSLTLPSGYTGVVVQNGNSLQLTVNSVAVPEPGTLALLGMGGVLPLVGGVVLRRRRRA